MRKWLRKAIPAQSWATHKKCATFFVSLLLLFSSTHIAKATLPKSVPDGSPAQILSVSAVVDRSVEFSYALRKNSSVILEKQSFVLGTEGEIHVVVRGGRGEELNNHRVTVHIFNVFGQEIVSSEGESDILGQVTFRILLTELFLGKNTVQVIDTTYDESLMLMEQPSFVVYQSQNAQEKAEKELGRAVEDMSSGSAASTVNDPLPQGEYFFQKSATMALCQRVEALARAGPPIDHMNEKYERGNRRGCRQNS